MKSLGTLILTMINMWTQLCGVRYQKKASKLLASENKNDTRPCFSRLFWWCIRYNRSILSNNFLNPTGLMLISCELNSQCFKYIMYFKFSLRLLFQLIFFPRYFLDLFPLKNLQCWTCIQNTTQLCHMYNLYSNCYLMGGRVVGGSCSPD